MKQINMTICTGFDAVCTRYVQEQLPIRPLSEQTRNQTEFSEFSVKRLVSE